MWEEYIEQCMGWGDKPNERKFAIDDKYKIFQNQRGCSILKSEVGNALNKTRNGIADR